MAFPPEGTADIAMVAETLYCRQAWRLLSWGLRNPTCTLIVSLASLWTVGKVQLIPQVRTSLRNSLVHGKSTGERQLEQSIGAGPISQTSVKPGGKQNQVHCSQISPTCCSYLHLARSLPGVGPCLSLSPSTFSNPFLVPCTDPASSLLLHSPTFS